MSQKNSQKNSQRILSSNLVFWLSTVIVACLVALVRSTGQLQYLELAALDKFFELRQEKPTQERIIVVSVREDDVPEVGYPIKDEKLVKLLQIIQQESPAVIGLNLVRDSVSPELRDFLQNTPNLIGVDQLTDSKYGGRIHPIPVLKENKRTGGATLAIDRVDGKIRRGYLYPHVLDGSPQSQTPSFAWAIAKKYLRSKGIKPTQGKEGWMQLQQVWFKRFEPFDGGYINNRDNAYSILINWASHKSFLQFNVVDIFNGNFDPDLFKDKIVIVDSQVVGSALYAVPYSAKGKYFELVYASEIHANIINHILAAVLDNRPIIWSLSEFQEFIFTLTCLSFLAFLIYPFRYSKPQILTLIAIGEAILVGCLVILIDLIAFINFGFWLPLVPILIGIPFVAVNGIVIFYIANLNRYIEKLESQVRNEFNLINIDEDINPDSFLNQNNSNN